VDAEDQDQKSAETSRKSSGPLRLYTDEGRLFVIGFGLWIPVENEQEGRRLIAELEDQGYRICY